MTTSEMIAFAVIMGIIFLVPLSGFAIPLLSLTPTRLTKKEKLASSIAKPIIHVVKNNSAAKTYYATVLFQTKETTQTSISLDIGNSPITKRTEANIIENITESMPKHCSFISAAIYADQQIIANVDNNFQITT